MKINNLIIAFVCALFIMSCGNEYDTTEYFDLEELPAYVAFDADGNSVNVADRSVGEAGEVVAVTVEHATEILSDVTVNYTLGGTAVFGEDYTIGGATAAGGTMTISSDRGSVAETYRGDIEISTIDNDIADGDKTIILTLESASNSEGSIVVGRGGKDFQKVANVTIVDDECPSEYGGLYSVVTAYSLIDTSLVAADTIVAVEDYMVNINKTGNFTYTVEEASGGLFASVGSYGMEQGTSGFSLDLTEDCGTVTFENTMADLDRTVTDSGSSVNGDGVFTISVTTMVADTDTTMVAAEIFTSTYTPM